MHMYVESSRTASSSSGLLNSTNFEKISYNVHQQIEFIKKYKLNSDLNSKEKVCLEFGTQLELKPELWANSLFRKIN